MAYQVIVNALLMKKNVLSDKPVVKAELQPKLRPLRQRSVMVSSQSIGCVPKAKKVEKLNPFCKQFIVAQNSQKHISNFSFSYCL